MSILDNAPRSASPNPTGDHGPEIETSQLETPERTDTGDFPVLDAPVGETVPSVDTVSYTHLTLPTKRIV